MKLLVSRYQKTILEVTQGYLTRKWGYLGSISKNFKQTQISYEKRANSLVITKKLFPKLFPNSRFVRNNLWTSLLSLASYFARGHWLNGLFKLASRFARGN